MSEDNYYCEMATIAIDEKLNINVNPETEECLSIAYFKVLNAKSFRKATKVARLHFKDSGMEYHKDGSGKQPWILNSRELKHLLKLLKSNHVDYDGYTNWQIACYQWNLENGLIKQGMHDYFSGKYDHMYDNDSRLKEAYVPSTQEMPKTWEYEYINERSDVWDAFIPMDVDDEDEFFRELAEIYPKYNEDHNIKRNRFKVSVVQEGEGPVPHVHVYYEKKGSKQDVAYICLGKAKYAPQHIKETKILNSQEKKDLIKFFNTFEEGASTRDKDGNFIPCNCWQQCVDMWMKSYDTDPSKYFDIDEETGMYIMPDYSEL